MPSTAAPPRIYFTVLDEKGRAVPAVEYWAAHMDEAQEVHEVLPLRRFVKLIGPDEPLKENGEGVFEGVTTGMTFTRFPAAG
jgi:hypothetical protein